MLDQHHADLSQGFVEASGWDANVSGYRSRSAVAVAHGLEPPKRPWAGSKKGRGGFYAFVVPNLVLLCLGMVAYKSALFHGSW